jgi:hypothetical protein
VPREIAYNVGVPVLWLPPNFSEIQVAAEHLTQPIRGIVLTPELGNADKVDPTVSTWKVAWTRVSSLVTTTYFLPIASQKPLGNQVFQNPLFFPEEIRDIFRNYRFQPAVLENNDSQASLVWWEAGPSPAVGVSDTSREQKKVVTR